MSENEMARYYEEWWENPADPRNIVFDRLNAHVRSRIPPGRGAKALDIGSGRGTILGYLDRQGYMLTSVEISAPFAVALRKRFPKARVLRRDVRKFKPVGKYSAVTCIELLQNLKPDEAAILIRRLRPASERLFINISNSKSLHGWWVKRRGFMASFVHEYTPEWLEGALEDAGFRIVHRHGIGLVTPLTLWRGFRGRFIPKPLARAINFLFDWLFPRRCHLYYVEAV